LTDLQRKGLIYNIQHYCIHDGRGIRTAVFMKGCQLKCGWCANPESQCRKKEIGFFGDKCTLCGACARACGKGAIDLASPRRIDTSRCDACGDCVYACPGEALAAFGQEKTCGELVAEAEKDRPFYRKSGGGVTITGGEPTLQGEFLLELLTALRAHGLHTAIETHGHMPDELLQRTAPLVDQFLFDIKHMDSKKHAAGTGVPNEQIIKNMLKLALDYKAHVTMRVPLIPGFNDDNANMENTAIFAQALKEKGSLQGVHLLPFHALATNKYAALGKEYAYRNGAPQKDERLSQILEYFRRRSVQVQIGG